MDSSDCYTLVDTSLVCLFSLPILHISLLHDSAVAHHLTVSKWLCTKTIVAISIRIFLRSVSWFCTVVIPRILERGSRLLRCKVGFRHQILWPCDASGTRLSFCSSRVVARCSVAQASDFCRHVIAALVSWNAQFLCTKSTGTCA